MTQGWLLYTRAEYLRNRPFADQFVHMGEAYGLDVTLRLIEELALPLVGPPPQFVINRTRDAVLASLLETLGCRVFNPSATALCGNDKAHGLALAHRLGLPTLPAALCANVPAALVRHGLAYPVVVKDPLGHGGTGVFLARDENALLSSALRIPSARVLVQQLCDEPGVDVRFYVLGGKVLMAVRRSSRTDFRANVSLGGTAELYEPTVEERELVEHVCDALTLDYAGVDFLRHGGALCFNEIEDMVGSRALFQLGHNPVPDYLGHIACEMGAQ